MTCHINLHVLDLLSIGWIIMMSHKVVFVAVLFVCSCVLALSCKGKRNKKAITVLTYNLWLHEYRMEAFRTKEKRKKKIIRALKKSEADIICLQEVFFGKDVEAFVDHLQHKYPYAFSNIHTNVNDLPPQARGTRKPPCDYTRLRAYLTCIINSGCTEKTDDSEGLACVLSNCTSELQTIFEKENQECMTCIAMSTVNMLECTAIDPVVGGRKMNIGGLLLLSNRNLRDVSYTDYHPTTREIFPTGYIKAKVDDIATVVCTHLSATGTDQFFEPDLTKEGFTSYSDMNAHEIRALIGSLQGIQPLIILGDLNTGFPFKPQLLSVTPESYRELLKRFTTKPALKFTYRDPSDNQIKSVLDHVFVKNMVIRKTKRVYAPKDREGLMSDHVGVQSVVKAA